METGANFLPRNRTNAAGSIFSHSAFDFFGPSFFDARIPAFIKAVDQQTCELSAIFRRKL